METFGDRVRKKRMELGLSQSDLAKKVGSGQSTIGQIENGRNKSFRDILTLARVLNTTPEYLTTGENDAVFKQIPHPFPSKDDEFLIIPMYTAKGSCGLGESNEYYEEESFPVPKAWLENLNVNQSKLKIIHAVGDSMTPTINDGAMVILDESQRQPREGCVFAIERESNGLVLKRLMKGQFGGWIYKSDNKAPQYEDLFPQENDIIIGRVVWQGGNGGL